MIGICVMAWSRQKQQLKYTYIYSAASGSGSIYTLCSFRQHQCELARFCTRGPTGFMSRLDDTPHRPSTARLCHSATEHHDSSVAQSHKPVSQFLTETLCVQHAKVLAGTRMTRVHVADAQAEQSPICLTVHHSLLGPEQALSHVHLLQLCLTGVVALGSPH